MEAEAEVDAEVAGIGNLLHLRLERLRLGRSRSRFTLARDGGKIGDHSTSMSIELQKSKRALELEKGFLAAYDANADALFRHCVVRVRDRELAKDIVQETFTRTWQYLAKGKRVEHMRAFLYRTLHNCIVDTMRKKRSVSLDVMYEEEGFEIVDEPQEIPLEVREEIGEAMQLLSHLDEMYSSVITMRFIDELTPTEIAAILDVSENVVSVRIHRGVKQLRRLWENRVPQNQGYESR